MFMRLIGLKWSEQIEYLYDNIADKVPQAPGVCRVYVRLQNDQWSLVYVGQGNNLQERLWSFRQPFYEQNEKLNEYVRTYQCAFDFAVVEDPMLRAQAVRALIEEHRPELNEYKPAAEDAPPVRLCNL